MNTEENEGGSKPSWLDRLGQVISSEPQDREQLVELLRDAEQRNLFDANALGMLEGVLQVAELQVRDIMIPRPQMTVVERDALPEDFVAPVIDSGHSRFPVLGENRDEVEGILLAKDLLGYFAHAGKQKFNMRDILRPAIFVPESKRLNVLLQEFRTSRNHMAIVVDEYGGVAGLVTIEDVIEQIVGEIDDEHDVGEERLILAHSNGEYTVKAHTPIENFNEHFHTHFSDEDFDTIGGLVVHAFEHLPKRGETVILEGVYFLVLRSDKRRLHLLRVLSVDAKSNSEMNDD